MKMKNAFITTLLLIAALFTLGLASCANDYAVASPGFYKPAAPSDPAAAFGVFIKRGDKLTPETAVNPQK